MIEVVSVLEVSGWDKTAAVGTLLGAAATFVAVGSALWLGRRDRKAADDALQTQLGAQRIAREREHRLDLLLELQRQLARVVAHSHAPQGGEARQLIEGLLLALPDAAPFVATRRAFAPTHDAFQGMHVFEDVNPGIQVASNEHLLWRYAQQEIAAQLQMVARS